MPLTATAKPKRRNLFLRIGQWIGLCLLALWLVDALLLVAFKWVDPPTTALQTQRRLQAMLHGKPYKKQYNFVPLSQMSPNFPHAAIAAEDARFYIHHGFDWNAIELAAEHDMEGGRTRGGSTLTQQLVKNLFFGTGGSFVRKAAEFTLVPVAELVLGKQRILELYVNVVEWGPGVYGADAACRTWDKTSPRTVSRQQSARLAAILPAPLKRKPEKMEHYTEIILNRMRQMGW